MRVRQASILLLFMPSGPKQPRRQEKARAYYSRAQTNLRRPKPRPPGPGAPRHLPLPARAVSNPLPHRQRRPSLAVSQPLRQRSLERVRLLLTK